MREIANREIGRTVRQKLNRALTRVHDVRDYGAVGDGVTDDRAAIVAAIAAATAGDLDGVAVYIPSTTDSWYCSAGITLDGRVPTIMGDGYASRIRFGSGGFLRNEGLSTGGYRLCGFEKVSIISDDPRAWAIEINCVAHGIFIRDVHIAARYGVKMGADAYDWVIDNLACRSAFGVGTGLQVAGHGVITGYSANDLEIGVKLDWIGVVLTNARIEECRTGMLIGAGGFMIGAHISGVTLESCLEHIDIRSASHSTISGIHVLGYESTSMGPSVRGIRIANMTRSSLENIRVSGTYARSGVEVGLTTTGLKMSGIYVDGNSPVSYDFRATKPHVSGCNTDSNDPDVVKRYGSVDVGAGSAEILVPFPATPSEGKSQISNLSETSGTLPAGEYEYSGAVSNGLYVRADVERWRVPITSQSGGVVVNFSGSATGFERRIYRREVGGEFFGYFIQPDGDTSFTDSGQPFDGYGGVPFAAQTAPSYYGADTDYRVTLTPEFEATVWVKERRTDGILVGLSTGHGGGTLRWTLEN